MNDPANVSPTVAAAVTDLLSSFNNPDTTFPVAPPDTSNQKLYPTGGPGQNISNFCFLFTYFYFSV